MFATSGAGANGTGGYITTPFNVYGVNTSNYDSVVINIWMWGSYGTGYSSSIEAGVAYGYDPYCSTFTAYFHLYGTKDDGNTGVSACGTNVESGNTMWVSAYHDSASNAYSYVDYGKGHFSHNWGNYTDWAGYDNQSWYEVWSDNGNHSPSWDTSTVGGLAWENGSDRWSYWGYLNTSTDDENGCPYASLRLSNTAFQGYKISSCY